jgi:large repetitive protein
MRNKYNPTLGVGLACVLLLWGASGGPALAGKTTQPVAGATGQTGQTVAGATGQAAPILTASLVVNGVASVCGTTVASGAQVCLQYTTDQSGTAVVSIQNGTASATVSSGAVTGGMTYSACVTAGTADGLTRTFTVTVTNAAGQSSSQQCSYIVAAAGKKGLPVAGASGQAPTVTTSLLVNGTATACAAAVASGAQVCLELTADQSGTAVVSIQKGTASATVASGTVTAGTTYSICVTAGAADGQARTFTAMVTNTAGLASFQQCSYVVGAVAGATGKGAPTVTASLLVNGAASACGTAVASGAQVCLQYSTDQSGTAVVSIQKGTASATVSSGAVIAGTTYSACVTAGTADGLTRTFTVTVTNAAGQSSSQQCSYIVAAVAGKSGKTGQTGPTVTTSLLTSGTAATCGAVVTSGAQVCLEFTADQSGTAMLTIQNGTGTPATLASGAVTGGTTYNMCVTAGAADGQTRTFTVTVTTTAGTSSSQQCSYVVQ